MSYDDMEEKKGLRITNIILHCAAAGIYMVMAYALFLTTDYVRSMVDTYQLYVGMMPGMSYIANMLIGGLILQYCGVALLVLTGVYKIVLVIMKSGKP